MLYTLRKGFNNINIRMKIFIFLLGFCVFILLFLWLFQIVFLDNFYESIKIAEVKKSATALVNNVNSDDMQTLVTRISMENDVCVEILADDFTKSYSSDVLRSCVIHQMPAIEKALLLVRTQQNGGELLEYYDQQDYLAYRNFLYGNNLKQPVFQKKADGESIIFSKFMLDEEGQEVLVLINSVVSPVAATVKTLQAQLNYIILFMLLVAPFLAFVIARAVSEPIISINQSAKIMAKGNLNVRFDGTGYREINELSNTLNYTAKELDKVDRLKTELIANISHDLRTPLTLISGYAEIMRDLPDENNPENAQIIMDETKRLTSLVNDVLDISKLQSGTQVINTERYSLTNSVTDTVGRINEFLKKDDYVVLFAAEGEAFINADQTRITQVFYNLLTNAINYTGADKTVRVSQILTDSRVRIEVTDSGGGIAAEELDLIWERYYKGDKKGNTHKRAVAGSGLGLSIVKGIVTQHGGTYGVHSTVGQGSTFWFELDRAL